MFSRFRRLTRRLLPTKIEFSRPSQADVAILDSTGAEELLDYFRGYSVQVVNLDHGKLNFWALVKMLIRREVTQFNYLCEYLRLVKPRLCITLIDTTTHIYRLKMVFPSLRTISIQNGWRGYETLREIKSQTGQLEVDHMLCFGSTYRSTYSDLIKGTFHTIGSFRSNKVPIQIDVNSNILALISTLRPKVDLSSHVASYSGRPLVKYSEIFKRRLLLAKYIAEFCRETNMRLLVVGKDFEPDREYELYSQTLSPLDVSWEFSPRTEVLSSYRQIDRARIVVTSSSSMGYEALARGIRTAFFMIDPEMTGNWGDTFAWPANLADSGIIWTNSLDYTEIRKILWRLHESSNQEWHEIREQFVPLLISSDPENLLLQRLIRQLLGDELQDAK